MRSTPPGIKWSLEGGKYHLAEVLFTTFRYQIRCPVCREQNQEPGFIRDQAGKPTQDGAKRRYWNCRYSNTHK